MDQTVNEIEAHIDRARARLGSNLRELEDKIDAATDWREHFRERPHLFLGAAFVGGVLLGTALGGRAAERDSVRDDVRGDSGIRRAIRGNSPVRAQALDLWNNVQMALVGVASARIKEYIGEMLPDFDEHYRRAEQRSPVDPTRASLGRTGGQVG
jgi:hypothetical protein